MKRSGKDLDCIVPVSYEIRAMLQNDAAGDWFDFTPFGRHLVCD
jgi:hypothetical protein